MTKATTTLTRAACQVSKRVPPAYSRWEALFGYVQINQEKTAQVRQSGYPHIRVIGVVSVFVQDRGDLTFGADYPVRTLGLTLD